MTMVLSYVWHDKIVMMADSRLSRYNAAGNFEYFDDRVKIHRGDGLVIGTSGLGKAVIRNGDEGKVLEVEKLVTHFFNQNNSGLAHLSGKVIVEGLVDTWNRTLKQSLGVRLKDHPVCFMLARWENGLNPMIYTCESTSKQTSATSFGGVIGDEQVQPIVAPYFVEDLIISMTFEDTIEHFKQAYAEVISKVETVGGKINVYVLDRDPQQSKWLELG